MLVTLIYIITLFMHNKQTNNSDILKTSILSEIKRIEIMMIQQDISDRKHLQSKLKENKIKMDIDRLNYILNKNKMDLVKKENTYQEILLDLQKINIKP